MHLEMAQPKELRVGQEVSFTFEAVTNQDGYRWRALRVVPDGGGPDAGSIRIDGPSSAYRSTLTIEFDEDPT